MSATASSVTATSDRWWARSVDAGYDTGAGRFGLGRQYFLEMTTPVEVCYRTDRAPNQPKIAKLSRTVDAEASGGGTSFGKAGSLLNRVAAPTDSKGFEPHNRLLAALSGWDLQSLQPHIEVVPLARGSVLFDVGAYRATTHQVSGLATAGLIRYAAT